MFEIDSNADFHRMVILTAPNLVELLTRAFEIEPFRSKLEEAKIQVKVFIDFEDIKSQIIPNRTTLLIFGSSKILSVEDIRSFNKRCFNLHAAPPSLPGRDPHHWAIYHGLSEYGATLHKVEPEVDSGEIYVVNLFPIAHMDTPIDLLRKANNVGLEIVTSYILEIVGKKPFSSRNNIHEWGLIKYRREDLLNITRMDFGLPTEEILLRIRAFDHSEFRNLKFLVEGLELVISEVHQIAN